MKRIFILLANGVVLAACSKTEPATVKAITDWEKNDLKGEVRSMQKMEYHASLEEDGEVIKGDRMGGALTIFNPKGYITQAITLDDRKVPYGKVLYQLNKREQRVSAQYYNGQGEWELGPVNYQYDASGCLINQFIYDTTGRMVNKISYKYNDRDRRLPVEAKVYYDDMSQETNRTVSTYDHKGRMVEAVVHVPEVGEVTARRMIYGNTNTGRDIDTMITVDFGEETADTLAMTYRYDRQGNWVECVTRNLTNDCYTVISRLIEYYQ